MRIFFLILSVILTLSFDCKAPNGHYRPAHEPAHAPVPDREPVPEHPVARPEAHPAQAIVPEHSRISMTEQLREIRSLTVEKLKTMASEDLGRLAKSIGTLTDMVNDQGHESQVAHSRMIIDLLYKVTYSLPARPENVLTDHQKNLILLQISLFNVALRTPEILQSQQTFTDKNGQTQTRTGTARLAGFVIGLQPNFVRQALEQFNSERRIELIHELTDNMTVLASKFDSGSQARNFIEQKIGQLSALVPAPAPATSTTPQIAAQPESASATPEVATGPITTQAPAAAAAAPESRAAPEASTPPAEAQVAVHEQTPAAPEPSSPNREQQRAHDIAYALRTAPSIREFSIQLERLTPSRINLLDRATLLDIVLTLRAKLQFETSPTEVREGLESLGKLLMTVNQALKSRTINSENRLKLIDAHKMILETVKPEILQQASAPLLDQLTETFNTVRQLDISNQFSNEYRVAVANEYANVITNALDAINRVRQQRSAKETGLVAFFRNLFNNIFLATWLRHIELPRLVGMANKVKQLFSGKLFVRELDQIQEEVKARSGVTHA